jgi:hypothetical protein
LKENIRGASSGTDTPQLMQAIWSEYRRSRPPFSPSTLMVTSPSAILRDVSTESVRRVLMSGLSASRSTTISTVCFFFLSIGMPSAISITWPSTRARTNPFFIASASCLRYSPLRPRTIGASTWMRLPSGRVSTWSTICCTVCLAISRPHLWQ